MAVDHLSLYQLTIEDGTIFAARQRSGHLRGLPDDDVAADMYLETNEYLGSLGMEGYEISNHSRPGAESRHNLIYWRQGDWVGIGPGAHGRLSSQTGRHANIAEPLPGKWLRLVDEAGNGDIDAETLTRDDVAAEYLLMSMRLAEGMDLARYKDKGGRLDHPRVDQLIANHLLEIAVGRARVTRQGRPVLNYVLRQMVG